MNELIETGKHLPSNLAQEATSTLRQRLAQQMELSARHLVEMASIWTELERRGEDLSALRTGLTDYLPRIAAGELDAAAVVRFAGNRQLLRYLSTLDIERQQELISADTIELVLPESGDTTIRKLAHLAGREVTQVFGHGIVRSPDEQRQLIDSKRATKKAVSKRVARKTESLQLRYGILEADGERVSANGKAVRAEDLLDMLSKHYGVDLAAAIKSSR